MVLADAAIHSEHEMLVRCDIAPRLAEIPNDH